jgi:hypothetical protein
VRALYSIRAPSGVRPLSKGALCRVGPLSSSLPTVRALSRVRALYRVRAPSRVRALYRLESDIVLEQGPSGLRKADGVGALPGCRAHIEFGTPYALLGHYNNWS